MGWMGRLRGSGKGRGGDYKKKRIYGWKRKKRKREGGKEGREGGRREEDRWVDGLMNRCIGI